MNTSTGNQAATPASGSKKNDFDFVASFYDALATATFGGAIHRAQIALLPHVADIDTALIMGGGTGWILLELLARTRVRRVTYVELSPEMLQKSRELLERKHPEWRDRVEFREGTQDSLTAADGPFDLIVTNFFLDLFHDENCQKVATVLHKRLAPTGRWLLTDFHYPEDGWQLFAAKALFKAMFTFFNVFSNMESKRPPNYAAALESLGLREYLRQDFYATMIRAKLFRHAA